jgi:hypothetical protein
MVAKNHQTRTRTRLCRLLVNGRPIARCSSCAPFEGSSTKNCESCLVRFVGLLSRRHVNGMNFRCGVTSCRPTILDKIATCDCLPSSCRPAPAPKTDAHSVPRTAVSRCSDRPGPDARKQTNDGQRRCIVGVPRNQTLCVGIGVDHRAGWVPMMDCGIRITFQSVGYQPTGGSSVSWDYLLA